MNEENFDVVIEEIVTALKEKGYNPYEQIMGFLETNSEIYITHHGNARKKIMRLDKSKLKEYVDAIKTK